MNFPLGFAAATDLVGCGEGEVGEDGQNEEGWVGQEGVEHFF